MIVAMTLRVVFGVMTLCVGMAGPAGKTATLRGRVTTLRGEPIAGATIAAREPGGSAAVRSIQTSADGAYELDGLRAGRWRLQATALGVERESSEVELGPGEGAVWDVGLRVGQLTEVPPIEVSGVVRDLSGNEIPDASVVAMAVLNRRLAYSARTRCNGTFSIAVEDVGQYVVIAYGSRHAAGVATLMVAGRPVRAVEITVPPLVLD
jgi:hypothetical protein